MSHIHPAIIEESSKQKFQDGHQHNEFYHYQQQHQQQQQQQHQQQQQQQQQNLQKSNQIHQSQPMTQQIHHNSSNSNIHQYPYYTNPQIPSIPNNMSLHSHFETNNDVHLNADDSNILQDQNILKSQHSHNNNINSDFNSNININNVQQIPNYSQSFPITLNQFNHLSNHSNSNLINGEYMNQQPIHLNSVSHNVPLSTLNQNLYDLLKISLDIESYFNNANLNLNDFPKELVFIGYENLQKIQNYYDSWFKSLNIEKKSLNPTSNSNDYPISNNNNEISNRRHVLSPPLSSTINYNKRSKQLPSPNSPRSKSVSNLINSNELNVLPNISNNPFPLSHNLSDTSNDLNRIKSANEYGYEFKNCHAYISNSLQVLDENSIFKKNYHTLNSNSNFNSDPNSNSNSNSNVIIINNQTSVKKYDKLKKTNSVDLSNLKCMHCSSTGTPEWRRGPNGERTLCNACGLFYSKLIKKYGDETAKTIMEERKTMGKPMDRRISIT
jgi:hypothetical protein